MATATITTFDSILKNFYLGPVQDQINQEVFALELFEKATVDWNGKQTIIPIHAGRNTGVGFRAESGTLPTAGTQTFLSLTVQAKYQYGRFQVSGPAISAAAKGSSNSFISYVDAEMTKLVEDIRDKANTVTVSGGRVKGFITNRAMTKAKAILQATNQAAGAAAQFQASTGDPDEAKFANFVADYDGDYTPFLTASYGDSRTWIPIQLTRMDTYAVMTGDDSTVDWFVAEASDSSKSLGEAYGKVLLAALDRTTTLAVGGMAWGFDEIASPFAVAVSLRSGYDPKLTTAGGAVADANTVGVNLREIRNGDATATIMSSATYTTGHIPDASTAGTDGAKVFEALVGASDSGTSASSATASATADADSVLEPIGIFGNLADVALYGNSRSSTANTSLLSTVVTVETGACGADDAVFVGTDATPDATDTGTVAARADIDVGRIQQVMDEVLKDSGAQPDTILMSPLCRHQYVSLLSGGFGASNQRFTPDPSQAAGKGSAGFLSLDFAGIPINASRAVPNGMMIFLTRDTWKLTELEKADFADLDGNVLSRLSDTDAYVGFYRWYWNLVCTRPNANAILCGISLT